MFLASLYMKTCCLLDNGGLFNIAWNLYKIPENRFDTREKSYLKICFLKL